MAYLMNEHLLITMLFKTFPIGFAAAMHEEIERQAELFGGIDAYCKIAKDLLEGDNQ
jgi:hypothetical protein